MYILVALAFLFSPTLTYEWISGGRVEFRWQAESESCLEVESPLKWDTILACGTEGQLVTAHVEAGDYVSLRDIATNERITIQLAPAPPNAGALRMEWIGPGTAVFYFTGPGTLVGPGGSATMDCVCAARQLAPFPGLAVPVPGDTWTVGAESVVVPPRYFQSVLPWVGRW